MTTHTISMGKSPISYTARCSCGRSFETKRRQNAWARAGKLKAAVTTHLKEAPKGE